MTRPSPERRFRVSLGGLFSVTLGVSFSLLVFFLTYDLDIQRVKARHTEHAQRAFIATEADLMTLLGQQGQVARHMELFGPISRATFRALVTPTLSGPYHPRGLFGLSWNPAIQAADRARYEAAARADGLPDFVITAQGPDGQRRPAMDRDAHVFVQYIEPLQGNEGALGYDISSDPVRQRVIEAARDAGEPRMTAPITLVQATGEPLSQGALVLWPVYPGGVPEGVEARRAALLGFVVSVIRVRELVQGPLTMLEKSSQIQITDVTDPAQPALLYQTELLPSVDHATTYTFSVAGRQWQATAHPTAAWWAAEQSETPWVLLLAGTLISLLVGGYLQHRSQSMGRLRRSEARLREVLESASDAVVGMDTEGRVTSWNRSAERIFGLSAAQTMGQPFDALVLPPELRVTPNQSTSRLLALGRGTATGGRAQIMAQRPNGERFPVELAISVLERDQDREFFAFLQDVSARWQTEEQLRESQKLEAIGQLTGGLAHDFNNLLAIIVGNLELIQDTPNLDPLLLRRQQTAMSAALRGTAITRALLALARRQPQEIRPYDLNTLMIDALPLVQSTAGRAVTLHHQLCPQPLVVRLDAGGFTNLLLNLVNNARDALQDVARKEITLRTRQVTDPGDPLPAGSYGVVEVEDTGAGMAPAVQAKAFEPFFTTKEPHQGTGLGLAMVARYATRLGGRATLESEEGQGTTVRIFLPLTHRQVAAPPAQAPAPTPPSRGRILVVDDEDGLRQLACIWLEAAGYTTAAAISGEEALELLEQESFDLLCTDVVMPGGMDGLELAQRARRRDPALRVVLTSGFAPSLLDTPELPGVLLDKPYRKEQLLRAIHDARTA